MKPVGNSADFASIPLMDPVSGLPLGADRPWSLTDGRTRWPVVAGIPFLRVNRDSLRARTLDALDAGDERWALVLLLRDQDNYARIAPPDEASLGVLVDAVKAGRATLRVAMESLQFGPVADYFAFRWSSPTYLSGLALLERFGGGAGAGPVVEVACGIGHYLRDLAQRGRTCAGVDVVFGKLWLARQFLVPAEVPLVCGDVAAGLPLGPIEGGAVAFCHDAFYFMPEKPKVLAGLQRVVGERGRILIGHAHNRDFDHGGVSGEPKSPAEYEALLPGCTLFDDAELARSVWDGTAVPGRSATELAGVEAVALVGGADLDRESEHPSLLDPVPGATLRLNPLLRDVAGRLEPIWPSERFKAEYAAASGYLTGEPTPGAATLAAGAGTNPEVDRLARRRILLDLPERWGDGMNTPRGNLVNDAGRLAWGLVGCGWVASDYVAPAIVASGNGRLVGVFDPDRRAMGLLAAAATLDGTGPVEHESLENLLADPLIRAVYVATPNHLHAPIVASCARAGKAVLCEKPMATCLPDAEAMVEACEAAGVPYATAFDQRFHPAHRELRALVAGGLLGEITQARIHYACWLPGDWSGDNWRVDPARAGGGALIDLAPHGVDLLEVLLADEWGELVALKQRQVHDYAVDDGAILAGRFARGGLATLHVAYNCPERFPRRTLELIGTKQMAIATDTMGQTPGGRVVLIDAATGQRNETVFPDDPRMSPFIAQVEAFAGSILTGAAFPFPARRDLRTFALLEAACR